MPIELSPIQVTELAAKGRITSITYRDAAAATRYAVFRGPSSTVWNGSAMVTFDSEDWAEYVVAVTIGQGDARSIPIPFALPAGQTYTVQLFEQSGASPDYDTDHNSFYSQLIELDESAGGSVEIIERDTVVIG
jgi:hypothetical protein